MTLCGLSVKGNWAVAELLRSTYETLAPSYGIQIDTWHGSGASTKRDRVITRLDEGYSGGSASSIAAQACALLQGWVRMLQEHRLVGIDGAISSDDNRVGGP